MKTDVLSAAVVILLFPFRIPISLLVRFAGFMHYNLPLRLMIYAALGVAVPLAWGAADLWGSIGVWAFVQTVVGEWVFYKLGGWRKSKGAQVMRGNEVVDVKVVQKLVAKEDSRFCLGDVPFPKSMETRHFLFAGGTGTGKTRLFHQILEPTRQTRAKALVVDIGGALVSRYYNPATDIIMNPRDARATAWSPLAEIEDEDDIDRVAAALVPEGEGSAKEWNAYARTFIAGVLKRCFEAGADNAEILRLTTRAPISELRETLAGLAAEGLVAGDNEKMFSSIRAIASSFVKPLEALPPDAGANAFSVSRWVQDESEKNARSWIFFNFQDKQIESLKGIITACIAVAVPSILSLKEDPSRRIFFILDEADSLGEINGLQALLARGRRFGASCVLAMQSISQFRGIYGQQRTDALASVLSTQVILRLPDPATAEWASKTFGEQDILEEQHSSSTSDAGRSDNTSYSMRTQRVVMPSEIQKLPDLVALLNIAGEIPPCVIKVPAANPPQIHPEFVKIEKKAQADHA